MASENIALTAHLMRRAGFGAAYDDLERYASKGYEATVEELLHPEQQPEFNEYLMLRRFPEWICMNGIRTQQAYWVYRMINTKRPLEEKIALFWHGILCTGYGKVENGRQTTTTINLFREKGLGSFRDLLLEVSKDPGMVFYLDNCVSHKGAINENWARELLELFSMGVGNYTEQDIREAARAFTGWTIAPSFPPYPWGYHPWQFEFDPSDHDEGEKIFLGHSGRFNGEDIIDIICRQPATARFISRHLYNFFVADEGPVPQWPETPPRDPEALETLVDAYFKYDYDIRSMLRVLFNSDFFKNARLAKVKSPTELVIGVVRLVKDFTTLKPGLVGIAHACTYMGQQLLNPPSVEGWHTGKEWIDGGTLVERVNFASGLASNQDFPGVQEILDRLRSEGEVISPEHLVAQCLDMLGAYELDEDTHQGVVAYAGSRGELRTYAQEFPKRVADVLQVIVSTAEYQFG